MTDLNAYEIALVAGMVQAHRARKGAALTERDVADIVRCVKYESATLALVLEYGWEKVMFATAPGTDGGILGFRAALARGTATPAPGTQPPHLGSCGTAFRGCDPACPKDTAERRAAYAENDLVSAAKAASDPRSENLDAFAELHRAAYWFAVLELERQFGGAEPRNAPNVYEAIVHLTKKAQP